MEKNDDQHYQEFVNRPSISACTSGEELEDLVIKYAHCFAVVQINHGGWRKGEPNFDRTEHKTLEEAREVSKQRYNQDSRKRGCLIYAVADFPGARGFSRMIETYPESTSPYSRKAREAKAKGKKKLPRSMRNIPPPGTLPKSERYFEPKD